MAENEKQEGSGIKVADRRGSRREEPVDEPSPVAAAPSPAKHTPVAPPPLDFTTFILSLASTALIHLGAAPDPETGQPQPAEPELARQTIDLLGMLREKTRGNLTDEESRFFDAMLYDLRVRFVEETSRRT